MLPNFFHYVGDPLGSGTGIIPYLQQWRYTYSPLLAANYTRGCDPYDSYVLPVDGAYELQKVLAGLSDSEVQVTYEDSDSSIVVKCSRPPVSFGSGDVTWKLSKQIDPKSLKATLENGVLTVTCKVKDGSYKVKIN